MLNTPTLPDGLIVKEAYHMVFIVYPVEISNKGLVRNVLDRKRNEYQEAFDLLAAQAPKEANAIIGIQVSTAAQAFSNGTFLYVTLTGTPVLYE